MLKKGLLVVKRDENSDICQFSNHVDKVSDDEIYIRHGQLNSDHKIDGLGRKISLRPKYYGQILIDLVEGNTFIEEG